MDWVKSQDPSVDFPHQYVGWLGWGMLRYVIVCRIVKDKIGDSSVKLQFNQEEAWTRALRHVLLALKILLKWTTSGNNG
jgi:beclin